MAESVFSASMVAGSIFANASSTGAKTVNSLAVERVDEVDVGVELSAHRGRQRGQHRIVGCRDRDRVLRHALDRAGAVRHRVGVSLAGRPDEVGGRIHHGLLRHRRLSLLSARSRLVHRPGRGRRRAPRECDGGRERESQPCRDMDLLAVHEFLRSQSPHGGLTVTRPGHPGRCAAEATYTGSSGRVVDRIGTPRAGAPMQSDSRIEANNPQKPRSVHVTGHHRAARRPHHGHLAVHPSGAPGHLPDGRRPVGAVRGVRRTRAGVPLASRTS